MTLNGSQETWMITQVFTTFREKVSQMSRLDIQVSSLIYSNICFLSQQKWVFWSLKIHLRKVMGLCVGLSSHNWSHYFLTQYLIQFCIVFGINKAIAQWSSLLSAIYFWQKNNNYYTLDTNIIRKYAHFVWAYYSLAIT